MHVGGLASGMDTQATIDKLLELKRVPITLLEDRDTAIQADIAAWADVSTSMQDLTDSLDTLRSWDIWSTMSATSADDSALTGVATNGAAEATYTVTISRLAQAHTVASDNVADLSSGAGNTTNLVAAGVLTAGDQFMISGQTVSIGATESLTSLEGKINTAAESMPAADRVTATIIAGHLVLTRVNTGAADISVSDGVGTPLQKLGILNIGGEYKNELVPPEDALFTVNGMAVTRSSNTGLTDVIQNITLNLLQKTETDQTLTLTVGHDREAVRTAILNFVEKYNAAAAKLKEVGKIELSGTGSSGATVEGKGELYNDSLVREIYTNIRKQATSSKYPYLNPVNASYTYKELSGTCDSLSDLGIGTIGEENQLSVNDEERLDSMLGKHFDQVEQLFRGVFDSSMGYAHGVASDFQKYSDSVSASMLGAIARRSSSLGDQSDALNTTITKMEEDVAAYEQSLWEQFSVMENAVSKMQADLQWLQSAGLGS